jgi:hypothetical protein
VKISDRVFRDAIISGDYVVWQEGINNSGTFANDIYYLSIKDKRVRRVPNCDMYNEIDSLQLEGSRIYWANSANACSGGKKCGVIFEFDLEARLQPRIVSLRDAAYNPKVYKNNLVYEIVGNYGSDKLGLYYTDLLTGNTKKLSDRWDILSEYSTTLWEREIIIGRRDGIYGLNIDTMEEKIHYKTNNTIICEPGFVKGYLFPFKLYLEEDVYGHYTTDIYVLDIRDDSVRQITDDEVFQHAPQIYKNLLAWHENENPSSSSVDIGYVVIYDLENGNKRRIPNIYGIGGPQWLSDKYMLYYRYMGSSVNTIDLVNLEKLGVVKDGHVVPE